MGCPPRIPRESPHVSSGGRQCTPLRRPQPLHAPSLLVDEDENLFAYCGARRLCQTAQLVGIDRIARKQDDPTGPCLAQNSSLARGDLGALEAGDEGREHAGLTLAAWRVIARTIAADLRRSASYGEPGRHLTACDPRRAMRHSHPTKRFVAAQ